MANRKITVLYGSETGTAKEVAERIWREAKRSVIFMLQHLKHKLNYISYVILCLFCIVLAWDETRVH
jgi:flavodoxin